MEALHDLVRSGKVRYIGASSMWTYQLVMMQACAEKNGWTKFVSMQNKYSLLYREEEREMNKYCKETGVGLIPVSNALTFSSFLFLFVTSETHFSISSVGAAGTRVLGAPSQHGSGDRPRRRLAESQQPDAGRPGDHSAGGEGRERQGLEDERGGHRVDQPAGVVADYRVQLRRPDRRGLGLKGKGADGGGREVSGRAVPAQGYHWAWLISSLERNKRGKRVD